MKRITVLTLTLLLMLLGSFGTAPATAVDNLNTSNLQLNNLSEIRLEQEENITDSYYPVFNDIIAESPNTVDLIRERNDTTGEGAIVQVQSYANITFQYAVVLQNSTVFNENEVDLRLFADLPLVNTTNFNNTATHVDVSLVDTTDTISLDYIQDNDTVIDYHHPYTNQVIPNATLYYYETSIVLNMSANYVPFYVKDFSVGGLGEDQNNGPFNLLITGDGTHEAAYSQTDSEDSFYIQNEEVNITGGLFLSDQATENLGIEYRVDQRTPTIENFTLTYNNPGNGSGQINLGDFSPGTEISWSSIFFSANDTLLNISRTIENIDSKSVEVGDGTPTLTIDIDPNSETGVVKEDTAYTTNFTIGYTVEANVPKGNISSVTLFPTEDSSGSDFTAVNGKLGGVELSQSFDYSDLAETTGGTFNGTISAVTDKGLSVNETFKIIIDTVSPTITSLGTVGGDSIQSDDGRVTFNFAFSDDNSGIDRAILDLGNGEAVEVTGLESYTHRYKEFSGVTYEYSLTVIDFAGNSEVTTGTISINNSGLARDSGPALGIILFFVVLIALLTGPWWGPKVSEMLANR